MNELTIVIPGTAPSVNHMYVNRMNKKGRRMRVLTDEAEVWSYQLSMLAKTEARKQGWPMAQKGEKVIVELQFFYADKIRRDSHNSIKLLADSLQNIVYEDDYWALPRVMDIQVDKANPRIEIRCYRAEEVG